MDREEDCKKIIDRYSPDINKSINSVLEKYIMLDGMMVGMQSVISGVNVNIL